MNWDVVYSDEALEDLRSIYEYIRYVLQEPSAAERQVERILSRIESLESFPLRFPVYRESPWCELGLRFVVVDAYIVFYQPVEGLHRVKIIRIMYGRSNVAARL